MAKPRVAVQKASRHGNLEAMAAKDLDTALNTV